jgi:short subunit dehydrogenase-like uncharacterized protein
VPRIAVVGATGFTGGLVTEALARRGATLRLIGRDRRRLDERVGALPKAAEAQTRAVGDWTEPALAQALDGCAAVVACAGPFLRIGGPVVRAAIRARVHYCDSSGEQAFIREVFEGLDAAARAAGVALMPGAAYEYLPGDLGSALVAADAGPLDRLEVTYASESGAASAGTRRTMIEILAAAMVERVDDELRPSAIGEHRKRIETPFGAVEALSFPAGEAVMVPRHIDVRSVRSFIGTRELPRGVALLPVLRRLARFRPARRLLQRTFARMGPHGPNDESRARRFICHVEAWTLAGERRTVVLEATDPYGFTAAALAMLAVRMADGRIARTGAITPAQAVDARELIDALNVRVDENVDRAH